MASNNTSMNPGPSTIDDVPSPTASGQPPSETVNSDILTVASTSLSEPPQTTPPTSKTTTPPTSLPPNTPPTSEPPATSTPDVTTEPTSDPTPDPTTEPTTATPEPPTETTSEPTPTTEPPRTTPTSEPESVITSVITPSGSSQEPITVIQTSTLPPSRTSQNSSSQTSSSTALPVVNNGNSNDGGGGLTGAGRTAVAVVVPIVAVALIALAALWFWRRRKQRKDAEELRRKEVEEYGFNPNNDPTLPDMAMAGGAAAAGGPSHSREAEGSGYRGWGTTTAVGSSGRKASTQLSGGVAGGRTYSDPSSTPAGVSDARSGDPLVNGATHGRPNSGDAEPMGAMGPAAASNVHRGPSNASSQYSAGAYSDDYIDGEQAVPGGAFGAAQYYSNDGPYGDPSFGRGPSEMGGQPVIRDNLARRATRIENPSHFPTQQSAGISKNF